jgi:tetratricopeptide (TPR) repeat protein
MPSWRGGVLLVLLVLIPYLNSFDGDFVFDAGEVILNDERLQEVSVPHLRAIWTQDYWSPYILGLYRPVTTTTFWLNYSVFGNAENPFGYHIFNFIIHGLNCLLVWILMRRLMRGKYLPWIGALLYGVHPLQTEAVTNLVGRSDLLACLFILGGLWIHLENMQRGITWPRLLALSFCFLLGLLSKEVALVLIGVIFWYECCHQPSRLWSKSAFLTFGSLSLVLFLVVAWRAYLYWGIGLPPISYTDNPIVGAGLVSGTLTAVRILGYYLWIGFFPIHLSADYSYAQVLPVSWPPESFYDIQALISLACLSAIAIISFWKIRRVPTLVFLVGFFFGTLLPASNLLRPVASIIGERFLYAPLFGLIGASMILAQYGFHYLSPPLRSGKHGGHLGRVRHVLPVVLVAVAILFSVRTWDRNQDWQSNVSLFQAGTITAPQSARNHGAYAAALFQEYEPAHSEAVINRIIHHAEQAAAIIRTVPVQYRNVKAHMDLSQYYEIKASLLREKEDASGYEAFLKRSIITLEELVSWDRINQSKQSAEADKNSPATGGGYLRRRAKVSRILPHQIRVRMAGLYHELGMNEDASAALRQALQFHPGSAEIYSDLGNYREAAGHYDLAAIAYLQSIILKEQNERKVGWDNLTRVLERLGGEALISIDPSGKNRALDLNNVEADAFLNIACLGIYRDYLSAGRIDEARQFRDQAIRYFARSLGLFTEGTGEH